MNALNAVRVCRQFGRSARWFAQILPRPITSSSPYVEKESDSIGRERLHRQTSRSSCEKVKGRRSNTATSMLTQHCWGNSFVCFLPNLLQRTQSVFYESCCNPNGGSPACESLPNRRLSNRSFCSFYVNHVSFWMFIEHRSSRATQETRSLLSRF